MLFKTDPARYVTGDRRDQAIRDLRSYFDRYTGSRFDVFADTGSPYAFTSGDFLAVSMLGVEVPANAAIWILEDGVEQIAGLLQRIPTTLRIGDDAVDFSPDGPARQLWDLLRNRRWPDDGPAKSGLGPTKLSKLLAAKRPHLFPVYDAYIAATLLHDDGQSDWDAWQERFSGEKGRELRLRCETLRSDAGLSDRVSVLRVLDVAIWMQAHGREYSRQQS